MISTIRKLFSDLFLSPFQTIQIKKKWNNWQLISMESYVSFLPRVLNIWCKILESETYHYRIQLIRIGRQGIRCPKLIIMMRQLHLKREHRILQQQRRQQQQHQPVCVQYTSYKQFKVYQAAVLKSIVAILQPAIIR